MTAVLVVDDRPANRELLVALLGYRKWRVIEASDGAEALSLVRRDRPDLIISDILMPNMDGYDLVAALRSDPDTARIPVIFNSAHFLSEESKSLARRLGVTLVLRKPNEPEDVYANVDRALGQAAPPPAPADDSIDRDHLQLLNVTLRDKVDTLRSANERMTEIVALARGLVGETDPDRVLATACGTARRLIGARYALSAVAPPGETQTHCFGIAGLPGNHSHRLGDIPLRAGRLAALFGGQACLRLDGFRGSPEELGLPATFPPVSSLLAVPIHLQGPVGGWLCLGQKLGLEAFTGADLEVLLGLAALLGSTLCRVKLTATMHRQGLDLEREMAERRRAEEARQAGERRFRDIAESMSDWIWETGPDLTFNYFSSQAESALGIDPAKLIGHAPQDGAAEPTDTPAWDEHRRVLAERRPFRDFVARFRLPSGQVRAIKTSGKPVFDEAGAFRGYRGTALDVTEALAMAERQKQLEQRIAEGQRLQSLGTLAGGVAHDINNMLTPVLALSELTLESVPPDFPQRQHIETIAAAGHSIQKLVAQLLAFSRQQPPHHAPLAVEPLVRQALRLLRPTVPAGVVLDFTTAPDLPPIVADETQILQVVLNLCRNALDALRAGGGSVTVSLAPATVGGGDNPPGVVPGIYLRLGVQDDGGGMDAATRARIFEPFFTTKGVGEGTGLGLSVVHGIVAGHGGAIVVDSAPGRGTRFDIYFPVADPDRPPDVAILAAGGVP